MYNAVDVAGNSKVAARLSPGYEKAQVQNFSERLMMAICHLN
jgi:hypothetical protein